MVCNTCGDKKPKNDSRSFPKATVEIVNPKELALLRKVVVPASLGDDVTNPPTVGKYCNVILYYEANDQVYLYSSDGIPTRITVDITELKRQIKEVKDGLTQEISERKEEDQKIWDEIEVIEAASDVVDVVGTYAELEAYDTSKLHDKDLIKVLQDETHDDAITYYRWSTSTSSFSYVGSEGPYYTATETDTLLAAKQDTLIAGNNIQIAADGKTISATDTTYNVFTGATSLAAGTSGLVPAPAIREANKVLKGDATWGDPRIVLWMQYDPFTDTGTVHLFSSSDVTGQYLTWDEVYALQEKCIGEHRDIWIYRADSSERTYQVVVNEAGGDMTLVEVSQDTNPSTAAIYRLYPDMDNGLDGDFAFEKHPLQDKLTAGSNITISNNTISATDTTYTAGTGISISAQNVISATSAGGTIFYYDFYNLSGSSLSLYSDSDRMDSVTIDDVYAAAQAGSVMLVGSDGQDVKACSILSTISSPSSSDYCLSFYVIEEENFGQSTLYRIDSDGYISSGSSYFDFVKTPIVDSSAIFYYDYDAALAATSGDQISLYRSYEPISGIDPSTEVDSDTDLYDPMSGKTSFVLVGIYEKSGSYYIKCADAVISSAGSENSIGYYEDPYLSIIKDELQTKQIWKWTASNDTNYDLCLFKSNFQGVTYTAGSGISISAQNVISASPITLFYINGTLASKGSNYFNIYSDAAMTQAVTWSAFGEAVKDGVVRLIFDDTSNFTHYDYDIYLYRDLDNSYSGMESPTYYVYDGNTRSIRTISFNGSSGARVTNDLPLSANNISSNDWSGLWQ